MKLAPLLSCFVLSHLVANVLGGAFQVQTHASFRPKALVTEGDSSIEVYKDFFDAAEVDALVKGLSNVKLSPYGDGRLQGMTQDHSSSSSILVDRVQEKIHKKTSTTSSSKATCVDDDNNAPSLPVSVLTKSSRLHQDHSQSTGELVSDWVFYLVGDVSSSSSSSSMSKTKEDAAAFFHYNGAMYPMEPGSLFVFDGSKPHFTTIAKGTVTLVGPAKLDTLEPVGFVCDIGGYDCACDERPVNSCDCRRRRRLIVPRDFYDLPLIGPVIEFLVDIGQLTADAISGLFDFELGLLDGSVQCADLGCDAYCCECVYP